MSTTTTYQTIQILRSLFGRDVIPDQIVSDNGPHFIATEFMNQNGIKHIECSPYYPSSKKGQAERFVRSFKEIIRACEHENLSLTHKIVTTY